MHRQKYLLYNFLLIFVYAVVLVSGDSSDPEITYTCNAQKEIQDIAVSNDAFDHMRVLKNNDGYCKPPGKTKDEIMQCITNFKTNRMDNDTVTEVTILYEDETNPKIVGGKNAKYYTLTCNEEAVNKTAELTPNMKVVTQAPGEIKANLTEKPDLSIVNHLGNIFVGNRITLQMQITTPYKLLPQKCTAYRNEGDSDPYTFWDKCKITDPAIATSPLWDSSTDQSKTTLEIYAFKFINNDKLIIKCETTVCPGSDDVNCKKTCRHRRKRENTNSLNRKKTTQHATVSIALEVFDRRHLQENGSQVLSPAWYIYTIAFGMVFWITLNKF